MPISRPLTLTSVSSGETWNSAARRVSKTPEKTIDGVASQRALSPPRSFERASIQLGFPYAKGLSQAIYRVRFDDVVITSE